MKLPFVERRSNRVPTRERNRLSIGRHGPRLVKKRTSTFVHIGVAAIGRGPSRIRGTADQRSDEDNARPEHDHCWNSFTGALNLMAGV